MGKCSKALQVLPVGFSVRGSSRQESVSVVGPARECALFPAWPGAVLHGALFQRGGNHRFLWWAVPTKLRAAGVDLGTLTTLTSILVLPWIFKFLWSPLIDGIQTSRWGLRSWIVSAQLVMVCTLVPLLFQNLVTGLPFLLPFLLLHAVAAATQGAPIDALAIAHVPDAERGSINGWLQLGVLAGRSAMGGGALLLEQWIGTAAVIVLLMAVILSSSVLVLLSRIPPRVRPEEGGIRVRMQALGPRIRAALRTRATWTGLLFALIGGAGFEAVGGTAGSFLIDRNFEPEDIGRFFAFNAVLAMMAGAVIGGSLAAILTLLYLCIGLFTASSYALFMEITDPALGATQFCAFMGATNGCES